MSLLNEVDLPFLCDTSREAGEAILEVYRTDFDVERKSDSSPVTEADLRAHKVIKARLVERYPDVPLLSEESSEHAPYGVRREWSSYWLVDPLDGTKEFIKRNGQFTVNIALIENSRPVAGVVYAPARELLYCGSVSNEPGGAFKVEGAGAPVVLDPSPRGDGRRVIAGSLSHPSPEMEAFVADQRRQYPRVEFIAMGSSLKICMVADGTADVYPRLGPTMEWDTAAAHAVASAAGCRVVRYGSDEELRYNKEDLLNDWFVVSREG